LQTEAIRLRAHALARPARLINTHSIKLIDTKLIGTQLIDTSRSYATDRHATDWYVIGR